jgi:hypothetical protein
VAISDPVSLGATATATDNAATYAHSTTAAATSGSMIAGAQRAGVGLAGDSDSFGRRPHLGMRPFGAQRTHALHDNALRERTPTGWERAGLEPNDLQLHEGRHTYSSFLSAAGIPRERRDCYLGHADRTMDGRYTHQLDAPIPGRRQDAERLPPQGQHPESAAASPRQSEAVHRSSQRASGVRRMIPPSRIVARLPAEGEGFEPSRGLHP